MTSSNGHFYFTSDVNVQIKAFEEDIILCYEFLFSTQVQMLKSFNSLLIDKAQGTSCQNFSSPLYVHEFFWYDGLVQNFFSYVYALEG